MWLSEMLLRGRIYFKRKNNYIRVIIVGFWTFNAVENVIIVAIMAQELGVVCAVRITHIMLCN